MRVALLSLLLASAACAPTLPPHFAESTEVLAPREVGLTVAGGAAGLRRNLVGANDNAILAGEVRVRVGLGAKQEVGVSAFGGQSLSGTDTSPIVVGGKVSYKVAPIRWLAVVAGAGVYVAGKDRVEGVDLAVIVAPYTDSRGTQVYTGVRGSLAIPTFEGARGMSEGVAVPLGLAIHSGDNIRFFVEGGFLAGVGQYHEDPPGPLRIEASTVGGYGLLAVTFIIR